MSLIAVAKGSVSRNGNSSGLAVLDNDEEWVTKRKVETTTTKTNEQQVAKQVVLEDGRIVHEDEPEITVNTIEDKTVEEDSGDEDRKISFPAFDSSTIALEGDVISERHKRDINTLDVQHNTTTTAAARNLGGFKVQDVDKALRQGRDIRSLAKPYDGIQDESALAIPARVIHRDQGGHRIVDTEDTREIGRLQDGKLRTERYVNRTIVDDDRKARPDDDGSSFSESDSEDGDGRRFNSHKEERFIDYYHVRPGRPIIDMSTGSPMAKGGRHLGRGLHMSSEDKDSQRIPRNETNRKHHRLSYHGSSRYHENDQSDSTTNQSSSDMQKPPRPRRSGGSRGGGGGDGSPRKSSVGSSGGGYQSRRHGIPASPHQQLRRKSSSSPERKYQTAAERSRSLNVSSTSTRSYQQHRAPTPINIHSDYSDEHSSSLFNNDQNRRLRSKSNSRPSSRPSSSMTLRNDLDAERKGRLRRAMSFSSKSGRTSLNSETKKSSEKKSSIVDSVVKSLYATISKVGDKTWKSKSRPDLNEMFDDGKRKFGGQPSAPPRRNKSRSSSTLHSGSVNTRRMAPQPPRSQGSVISGDGLRTWSAYSVSNRDLTKSTNELSSNTRGGGSGSGYNARRSRPVSTIGSHRSGGYSSRPDSRTERLNNLSRSIEEALHNREQPRFEPERHQRDRFGGSNRRLFGQSDGVDEFESSSGGDDRLARRRGDHESRPPPDMRKLLLNNVNLSRKKSMTRDPESRPVISSY